MTAELERELGATRELGAADTHTKAAYARERAPRQSPAGRACVLDVPIYAIDARRAPLGAAARHRARAAAGQRHERAARHRFNRRCGRRPAEMLRFVIVSVVKIVRRARAADLWASRTSRTGSARSSAWMHVRIGPNRVGWHGLLQPFADVIKMLLKEIVVPSNVQQVPVPDRARAVARAGVRRLGRRAVVRHVRDRRHRRRTPLCLGAHVARRLRRDPRGLGIELEVRVPGRDALGGADRRLRDRDGLRARRRADGRRQLEFGRHHPRAAGHERALSWFIWPLFPLFVVYFISGVAETNRAPFDVAEGESEIVAGFHVEYSGIAFGLFFLAEYANMILITALTVVFFFGGWLSPFAGIPGLENTFLAAPSVVWLLVKMVVLLLPASSGSAPRFRAIATTRSCGSAGKC